VGIVGDAKMEHPEGGGIGNGGFVIVEEK